MWSFQYKHGDRPLEGFTIQRAAGRGGFGEVYYAVSDSGREVALKAITGYEQIELRGIGQCMNLKNPHLVTVFDVKYNDQGRPFVIMEFVAGPSLRQLLDESPGGLGSQKAAFFLREIGKGLTYLHECGIVHRDLKPGNIFYENGYVKIGDYGLSKAMEPTQHSGQTITVGTVHYMAPEIGGGRYDKSIDIYAMGAVLYEMLTGQPPFLGASAGEILIKHLSSEPDFTNVEEPFRTVVRKAMAKNPADRYASVQEMVEAVFGAEHIQQSVSCFSPDSLSMIAQRVAQRVAVGGGSATPPPIPRRGSAATATAGADRVRDYGNHIGRTVESFADRIGAWGERMGELGCQATHGHTRKDKGKGRAAAAASPGDAGDEFGDPLCDPLSKRQRRLLALVMLALVSVAAGALTGIDGAGIIAAALCTAGATAGLRIAGRSILPQMDSDSPFLRRLVSGGMAAGMVLLCGIPVFASLSGGDEDRMAMTALGVLIALLLVSPPDLSPSRSERVAFGPAVGAAFVGFIAWIFTQGFFPLTVGILAGSQLLAQALSPWDPFAARRRAQREGEEPPDSDAGVRAYDAPPAPAAHGYHGDAPTMAWPPPVPNAASAEYAGDVAAGTVPPIPYAGVATPIGRRPVPVAWRYFWLACVLLLFPGGIALIASANTGYTSPDQYTMMCAFGVSMLALATLGLGKVWQSTRTTMWRYAGRYLVAWACFILLMISAMAMGNMNLNGGENGFALFVLVLSALLIPMVLFVRFSSAGPAPLGPLPGADLPAIPPPASPFSPAGGEPVMNRADAIPGPQDAPATRRQRNERWRWHEGRAWRVSGPPFLVRVFTFFRDLVVGTSVMTLLLVATLAAAFVAMDVPGMMAAGIPHRDMGGQITQKVGFSQWPQLARTFAYAIGGVSLMIAAIVLIVSRRKTYGLHMLRGLVGVMIFAAGLLFLEQGLGRGRWAPDPMSLSVELEDVRVTTGPVLVPHPPGDVHLRRVGPDQDAERMASAFQRYLHGADGRLAAPSAGFILLGIVLICWPARKTVPAGRRGNGHGGVRVVQKPLRAPDPAADADPVPAPQQA